MTDGDPVSSFQSRMARRVFLIYVASPYRSPTQWAVRKHIEIAADRCREIWRLNVSERWTPVPVMPVSPVLNSAWMGGVVPDEIFLDRDLELLRRCDALITTQGWESSRGVQGEIEAAERWRIPWCHTIEELIEHLVDLGGTGVPAVRGGTDAEELLTQQVGGAVRRGRPAFGDRER